MTTHHVAIFWRHCVKNYLAQAYLTIEEILSPNISILLNYSCHIVPNTASYKSRIIERLNLKQVSSSDLKRLLCQFRQQEELTC